MKLKRLKFRNIQSYGNNMKEITFKNDGLILLTGQNGAGKSTILNCIELALYGVVRGKKNTKISLKKLVNRINKTNSEVEIEFDNNDNNIIINRTLSPNTISVKLNNESYTDKFKLLNEQQRDNLIGYNYQTFKSFISLNINDFNNFIDMDEQTKIQLTDKLFNLEKLSQYQSIACELIDQYNRDKTVLTTEISIMDKELLNLKNQILAEKTRSELNKDELIKKLDTFKLKYKEIQGEIKIIQDKQSELLVNIQSNKNLIDTKNSDNQYCRIKLTEIRTKIQLLNSDTCPYCDSDLHTDNHTMILTELNQQDCEYTERIVNNDVIIKNIVEQNSLLYKDNSVLSDKNQTLNTELTELRTNAAIVKAEFDKCDLSVNVSEIKDRAGVILNDKKSKLSHLEEVLTELKELSEISKLFGKSGVRLNILASIIPDVNSYLQKMLKSIKYPYSVKIKNDLSVDVQDRGEVLDTELSSNGENRILDICIAISYLYAIKKIKTMNVLFMDELFQSIHKDNIQILLKILKEFAIETKTQIFLIHHGLEDLESTHIDSIIRVKKNIFSDFCIE